MQYYKDARDFFWLEIINSDLQRDTMNIFYYKFNQYEMYSDRLSDSIDTILFRKGNYIIYGTWRPSKANWSDPGKFPSAIEVVNETIIERLNRRFPLCK